MQFCSTISLPRSPAWCIWHSIVGILIRSVCSVRCLHRVLIQQCCRRVGLAPIRTNLPTRLQQAPARITLVQQLQQAAAAPSTAGLIQASSASCRLVLPCLCAHCCTCGLQYTADTLNDALQRSHPTISGSRVVHRLGSTVCDINH